MLLFILSQALLPSILGLVRIGQVNFVEAIEKEVQQALNETLEKCHVSLQSGESGHASEDSKLVSFFLPFDLFCWLFLQSVQSLNDMH